MLHINQALFCTTNIVETRSDHCQAVFCKAGYGDEHREAPCSHGAYVLEVLDLIRLYSRRFGNLVISCTEEVALPSMKAYIMSDRTVCLRISGKMNVQKIVKTSDVSIVKI